MYGNIYKITNLINNKIYIGQTIYSIEERWKAHCTCVKYNNHHSLFHNAIRKYGEENFKIELIDTADTFEELNEKEIKYIKEYNSLTPNGYNMTEGGQGVKGLDPGYHDGMKGKTQSDHQKDTARNYMKNRIISEETRIKMSESAKKRTANRKTINDKIWLTNGTINVVVNKEEVDQYLKNGYYKGLTFSEDRNKKFKEKYKNGTYISKNGVVKHVQYSEIQKWLDDGWLIGKKH